MGYIVWRRKKLTLGYANLLKKLPVEGNKFFLLPKNGISSIQKISLSCYFS